MRGERRALEARQFAGDPLTAEQAGASAVDAVTGIVATAHLQAPAGAFSFRSCTNATDPPYRAVVNVTFTVPQGNPPRYLKDVADAMTRSGWTEAAGRAPHFGYVLVRAGTTATFYRNGERTDLATMTVDG